jgi:hypothetical protein
VTENEAFCLAREIAKRVEGEMQYPGQIKVCVIRETRAVEYARYATDATGTNEPASDTAPRPEALRAIGNSLPPPMMSAIASDDVSVEICWSLRPRFFATASTAFWPAVYEANATVATAQVWRGAQDSVKIGPAAGAGAITFPRGQFARVKATVDLPTKLEAPVKLGQQIAEARLELDGKLLATIPLLAQEAVDEGSFIEQLIDRARLMMQ